MDMKDVYAALEKLDNGADLITAIKGEINTLNNEAKKNRIAGEHTAEKLKNVLAGLDLEDADDVADWLKENSWAVKANGGGGSGSPNGGNGGGSSDPFLAGFNS